MNCPYCKAANDDAFAAIAATLEKPQNRGITCCTTCGALLVADCVNRSLRKPTAEESTAIRKHPISLLIQGCQQLIRRRTAERVGPSN